MNRTTRAHLAEETVSIVEAGSYVLEDGTRVSMADERDRCFEQTRLYEPHDLIALLEGTDVESSSGAPALVELANETTLSGIAMLRSRTSDSIAALNFASANNPGGGFLSGSQAQEESLARSSALHGSLLRAWSYYETHRAMDSPLYSDAMILSPACPVFRVDSGALMKRIDLVTFISCAAPNAGRIRRDRPSDVDEIPNALLRRARNVLAVAAASGHKNIVLGAWGCGVFQNDPSVVAQTFARLLKQGWRRRFERIRFSVLDSSPGQETYSCFAGALES